MPTSRLAVLPPLTLLAAGLLGATAAQAADFPPISAEERALTSVPGHPGAPAVVLFEKGDFRMLDPGRGDPSSTLSVAVRLKVLTEQGKQDYGEIEVVHSPFVRLKQLRGRTVLPDGREVPLSEESVFERRASRSRRLSVTTAAFPALEVGAIVDYRYEVKFDTIYYLEPWVFQQEIPVLHSEIVYRLPREIAARAWSRDPLGAGIQHAQEKTVVGSDIRVWADNLPPILDEPHAFPPSDLAARFMLVPTNYGGQEPLLDTWATTCELIEEYNYGPARRNNTAARRRARELAGGGSPREQATALYRFVRDQIETLRVPGVTVDDKKGPDTVLADRRGDYADKAILLATLLDAVGVGADLVWAASRQDGAIDTEIPSHGWFDRVLVRAKVGGETVFLDPSEPGLAFGHLAPDHEGTPALVFHRRKPEVITLPATPFDANESRAKIDLVLDEAGRLSGRGSITESGHWAAHYVDLARQGEGPLKLWTRWLEEGWPGFAVADVEVQELVDERRVEVRWTLAQAEEEVLGDQASLNPSRPFGPLTQPLPQPPERRQSPVRFDWAARSHLELTLAWPPGWEVDVQPPPREQEGAVGAYRTVWQVDPEGRRLTFSRRLERRAAEFLSRNDYAAIRALYELAEKTDAQDLVLVRR